MASEAPSTERDGNRWALLYITAPTPDPTAVLSTVKKEKQSNLLVLEAQ